jgi:hypothetical protein
LALLFHVHWAETFLSALAFASAQRLALGQHEPLIFSLAVLFGDLAHAVIYSRNQRHLALGQNAFQDQQFRGLGKA